VSVRGAAAVMMTVAQQPTSASAIAVRVRLRQCHLLIMHRCSFHVYKVADQEQHPTRIAPVFQHQWKCASAQACDGSKGEVVGPQKKPGHVRNRRRRLLQSRECTRGFKQKRLKFQVWAFRIRSIWQRWVLSTWSCCGELGSLTASVPPPMLCALRVRAHKSYFPPRSALDSFHKHHMHSLQHAAASSLRCMCLPQPGHGLPSSSPRCSALIPHRKSSHTTHYGTEVDQRAAQALLLCSHLARALAHLHVTRS
jgi:hypothetical protein